MTVITTVPFFSISQTQTNMSGSNRQASLSPNERQRTKSSSPSRSQRTDGQTAKRSPRANKRAESTSSNPSKRPKSKGKTSLSPKSKSPSPNRKDRSKKKSSPSITNEIEEKQLPESNTTEKQDLSYRGLSVVPGEIFDRMFNLLLIVIFSRLFSVITLRQLILANNNLAGLPPDIRLLVNLEYLDISRNPLRVKNGLDDYSCLPRELRSLRNLQTLIMAECTLKHLPVAIWSILSLQVLDVSRNKVGYIVSEIGNLTDIRHLRLAQMDLDTLPPEIGFCDQLETIDLMANPIDNLPETLVECRQLYELKISYKTFYKLLDSYMFQLIDEGKIRSEHIPHVIFELENLQVLDLNQAKLNFIPPDHTLLHLTELYLSKNSFYTIPESICSMKDLKLLDMSHNRIETIPEYFLQIKRLETLILSYNKLTTLPKIIARLPTILRLIFNHNQIDRIEHGVSRNRSLLMLDLSHNKLQHLPDEFCQLKQLETLDLRYNQFKSLPIKIYRMKGLKSMNLFNEDFQRIGLHLIGNAIDDPPSYIWKSTKIESLFDYMETKEKNLCENYTHFKVILLGPKHSGKTTLMTKLMQNHKYVSQTRKTLDMYMSILQENQWKSSEEHSLEHRRSSEQNSSVITDQWIENRVSTCGDYTLNRSMKIKRDYPPPLHTYRSNELFEYFYNKSTIITKNNLFCTIIDITHESSFEILYPLLYDSNALFLLPINLTALFNVIQTAMSLDKDIGLIDYETLLNDDWLDRSIVRYIQSFADQSHQVSIAIVGLISNCPRESREQVQELLDEIHSKVNMFFTNEQTRRTNLIFYSEFFPEPMDFFDEDISDHVIEIFETIAQQWNIQHHKHKRHILKQRLRLFERDSLLINYQTFEQSHSQLSDQISPIPPSLETELTRMTLNDCLTYLTLTGDILCLYQTSPPTIILKPYFLLNNILSRTIFRPRMDQWLNYEENLIFHFSGYYPNENLFELDRDRLLTRGEFTWSMLSVLFFEQNLTESTILEYCHLMERLSLGFLTPSNVNCKT